ncbi:hypothetical protein BCR32DRAFT_249223 [Anaeromyces robustus]|uniref:Uncharacterized protein n=1 Tax=Anaeromyces robustus TaxID=1754192 RepID=A0A1Y1WQU2_9FUNG|nr:hypothetical protein BCR32DRAFT_249223 [Anaeromyces robustus]|eukprot:ORX75842.1 hypothetical protein BCR32DRAFT_249223 [Anaeromyces robustus]
MPKTFYMPMEQDKWRIKILMQQFYLQLYDEHERTEMETFYRENDILYHILAQDDNIYYDPKISPKNKIKMYTEYRIILLLLLFGSLLPEFPKEVIQKGLEYFFAKENDEIYEPFINNPEAYACSKLAEDDKERENNKDSKKHYWVENPTSPLLWSEKLMLFFIHMLISRIELETESASSFQNSNDTALLDKKTLGIMKLFIYNRSQNNLNGNDYSIYGSYAYIKNNQQVHLARINLRLIQLLTFIPKDMFFLTHFQTLYNIYAKAILLLIPITYLETSDYNFFMTEEEMIYYLKEDKDSKEQQKLNQIKFEQEMQKEVELNGKKKSSEIHRLLLYGNGNGNGYNKYKLNLNDILRKKVSPLLINTSKYQRLFSNSMDIHGRAVELRFYLNNSIMHVYEAEEAYDLMNQLLAEDNLMIKGQKVFFNKVEVSLIEDNINIDNNIINIDNNNNNNNGNYSKGLSSKSSSTASLTKNNINNNRSMNKIKSTGNLLLDEENKNKMKNRSVRRQHSLRSTTKSISHYELLARQRSANLSRATLLSAASSTLFPNMEDVKEINENENENKNKNKNKQLEKDKENVNATSSTSSPYMKENYKNKIKTKNRTRSSLFDQNILDDTKLLKNIQAINETIMGTNTPKTEKHEKRGSVVQERKFSKQENKKDNKMINKDDENEPLLSTGNQKDLSLLKKSSINMNKATEKSTEENDHNKNEKNEINNENKNENEIKSNNTNNNNNNNNNNSKYLHHKSFMHNRKSSNMSYSNKSKKEKNNKENKNDDDDDDDNNKISYNKFKNDVINFEDGESISFSSSTTDDTENDDNDEDNDYDDDDYDDDDDEYQNNYSISKDFTIHNTLTNNHYYKKRNANTYTVKNKIEEKNGSSSVNEKNPEDELINYILYNTDIAKNKNINKNNTNNNNTNDNDNVNSSNQQKNEKEISKIKNKNFISTTNAFNEPLDITTSSINYHLSRMPILGSARNYKKKTKKDLLLDQLNSFYHQENSSDSDVDTFNLSFSSFPTSKPTTTTLTTTLGTTEKANNIETEPALLTTSTIHFSKK